MKNADMPAAPTKHDSEQFQSSHTYTTGLTKREYFAGLAMQGFCAFHGDGQCFGITVRESLEIADELLAALDA